MQRRRPVGIFTLMTRDTTFDMVGDVRVHRGPPITVATFVEGTSKCKMAARRWQVTTLVDDKLTHRLGNYQLIADIVPPTETAGEIRPGE